MARRPKQPQPTIKQHSSWSVYHLKSTPAKLVGIVDAPDAETAIARALAVSHIGGGSEEEAPAGMQHAGALGGGPLLVGWVRGPSAVYRGAVGACARGITLAPVDCSDL